MEWISLEVIILVSDKVCPFSFFHPKRLFLRLSIETDFHSVMVREEIEQGVPQKVLN